MKAITFSFLIVAALFFLSQPVFSQTEHGPVRPMTVVNAKQLVAAAIKSSCSPPQGSCSGVFCVVDDAASLVLVEAIDGVISAAPKLCIAKAESAEVWRHPTQNFMNQIIKGTNTSFEGGAFPNMEVAPGGIALSKDNRIIGGFGVAGVGAATNQIVDAVIAEATKMFGVQVK